MQNKQELRKFAKELRKTLNINEISEKILQIFLSSEIYKKSKNIACYYPYGNELDITPIFKDTSKNFYLPKMNENAEMTFHSYKYEDFLLKNSYGILEPETKAINPEIMDLMILPALMADKKGYRLGYGKGCYDKFLHKNDNNFIKVIFIPDELFTDILPIDEFDIPADYVLTQMRIIKTVNA